MLLKILGWFWVITGVLFLFKPEFLRNRLKKKSVKKLRRFFFAIALALGVLLIKATWGVPGVLAKIVLVCGLIAIIKAFFFLKSASADVVIAWFLAQPLEFLRGWAAVQIGFGVIVLIV